VIGLDIKRIGEMSTVLCIGAHCDDIEIGCGGTLIRWVREYPRAHFVWTVFAREPVREAETRAAAEQLLSGARSVDLRCYDFRPGYFPSQHESIKDTFESLKQELRPDVILTHRREDRHQDHALLADLTWNTFRSHLILEYEIAKYEGDLGHPNLFVPLSKHDVERKIAVLIDSFPSQRHRSWFTADTFRGLARLRGIESAAPEGFAEAFHARKLQV
jgi:LmbE family N-acetylglucosaminyl deacetylase